MKVDGKRGFVPRTAVDVTKFFVDNTQFILKEDGPIPHDVDPIMPERAAKNSRKDHILSELPGQTHVESQTIDGTNNATAPNSEPEQSGKLPELSNVDKSVAIQPEASKTELNVTMDIKEHISSLLQTGARSNPNEAELHCTF